MFSIPLECMNVQFAILHYSAFFFKCQWLVTIDVNGCDWSLHYSKWQRLSTKIGYWMKINSNKRLTVLFSRRRFSFHQLTTNTKWPIELHGQYWGIIIINHWLLIMLEHAFFWLNWWTVSESVEKRTSFQT